MTATAGGKVRKPFCSVALAPFIAVVAAGLLAAACVPGFESDIVAAATPPPRTAAPAESSSAPAPAAIAPSPTPVPTAAAAAAATLPPSPVPAAAEPTATPPPAATTPSPELESLGEGDDLITRLKRSAKDALLKLVPDWKDQGRINILLLGIDKQDAVQGNTDVMMLASIDPATNSAFLLSIPRHLCLDNCVKASSRLNALHARIGPEGLKNVVSELLGLPVDFFAAVNFNGFAQAVDMVGGLDVWVERDFDEVFEFLETREELRLRLNRGWHHLDGRESLLYSRSRKFDAGGDFARICRQQQIVRRLRESAVSLRIVPRAPQLIAGLGRWFSTDFPVASIPSFGELVAGIPSSRVHSYTLTADNGLLVNVTGEDGAQLMQPNRAAIRAFVDAVLMGAISDKPAGVSSPCSATPGR